MIQNHRHTDTSHKSTLYNSIVTLRAELFSSLFAHPFSSSLSIRHHVPHPLEVRRRELLLQLLPREPLEVCVPKRVPLEVGLAGHDAALDEEGLLAALLDGAIWALGGLVDDVGDGDAADDPGVHVGAGGLGEHSLGGLGGAELAFIIGVGEDMFGGGGAYLV